MCTLALIVSSCLERSWSGSCVIRDRQCQLGHRVLRGSLPPVLCACGLADVKECIKAIQACVWKDDRYW